MILRSARTLKNRNVDTLLISYYTVAFTFSNYLKTCAHITNRVHAHAKKSSRIQKKRVHQIEKVHVFKKVHKFKKFHRFSKNVMKLVHRLELKKFSKFEKSSSDLEKVHLN